MTNNNEYERGESDIIVHAHAAGAKAREARYPAVSNDDSGDLEADLAAFSATIQQMRKLLPPRRDEPTDISDHELRIAFSDGWLSADEWINRGGRPWGRP